MKGLLQSGYGSVYDLENFFGKERNHQGANIYFKTSIEG